MSQSAGQNIGEERKLPGPNAKELIKLREQYIPKAEFQVVPTCVDKTEGARIQDVDDNEYIDFASGISCLNVGHTRNKVTQAIKEQTDRYLHASFNVTMYEPFIKVSKRLCESAPGNSPKQALLFNSGAEAVENAIKVARKYTGKYNVIAFEHAFHGRTQLTMGLTSRVKNYKYGFGPTDLGITRFPYPYCYRCPYDKSYPDCGMWCVDRIEETLETTTYVAPEETAAIIVEPVLGEGGYVVPPPEFLQRLREICDRYNILLISDEIQAGAGRTGEMWAVEQFNVVPDIITAAKSIAGGMVLSATIGRKEIMDSVGEGGLGGTFGGNPVSCAASLAALDIIENEGLLDRAQELGKLATSRLEHMEEQYELIGDIRSLGSAIGVEFVKDRKSKKPAAEETSEILKKCHEKGLIIMSCGSYHNVIRIMYPLTINKDDLEEGFNILEESLSEVS